jgi:hypothetical protein
LPALARSSWSRSTMGVGRYCVRARGGMGLPRAE